MSAVEDLPASRTTPEPAERLAGPVALRALCPYLGTLEGTWRSSSAVREHRCLAVSPPVPLAAEKQRRLCLVADHVDCATYGAAIASQAPSGRHDGHARPVARMTPVILDHGRFDLRLPSLRADRGTGQAALVAVLGIALVAILVARPSGNAGAIDPNGTAVASGGASSVPTEVAVAPSVAPSPDATPTEPPATPQPSAASSQAAAPTAAPTASAEPTTSGATYKVKSGDTLSAIAARFGTTTRVLVRLNGITDPSRLKVGQILKLP
jgi:LysM repeat protein